MHSLHFWASPTAMAGTFPPHLGQPPLTRRAVEVDFSGRSVKLKGERLAFGDRQTWVQILAANLSETQRRLQTDGENSCIDAAGLRGAGDAGPWPPLDKAESCTREGRPPETFPPCRDPGNSRPCGRGEPYHPPCCPFCPLEIN